MLANLAIFVVSLGLVIKGATFATRAATRLTNNLRLSYYAAGFIVVAFISILPEAFIAITSALSGVPEFGLSVIYGSNIADLTIIFALIILLAGRGLKLESKILKMTNTYPFVLILPIILGFDGYYSRFEGVALILVGLIFYYLVFKSGSPSEVKKGDHPPFSYEPLVHFLAGMAVLLFGAHFTVDSATFLADYFNISPILIGLLVVGLGTNMPELFFGLKSLKSENDDLAVGDILGIVMVDATVVVGILALVTPFAFPPRIIYITGVFMVVAAMILSTFMRTGRMVTRKEGAFLLGFWVLFILVEFFAGS